MQLVGLISEQQLILSFAQNVESRRKNMKIKSVIKTTLILSAVACASLSSRGYSAIPGEIKIRSGVTGYVGDVIPITTQYATASKSLGTSANNAASALMGFSRRSDGCAGGSVSSDIYGDSITYIPGSSEYGIRVTNELNPSINNYLVLAINGTIEANYMRYGGYTYQRSFGQLVRSKLVNAQNLVVKQFLCFKPPEISGYYYSANFSFQAIANITSYSVYASGNITPGYYSPLNSGQFFSGTYWVREGIYSDSSSTGSSYVTFPAKNDIRVTVLQSCDIFTNTSSKIDLGNYLAETFSSPKLLKSEIAGVSYNCNGNGDVFISFQALNPLKNGSKTQMELTPQTASSNKNNPYVVTSYTPGNDSLCQNNAEDAITYFEEHLLGKSNGNNLQNKNFYFNLCADGQISSSRYSGAIEVSVMIE